MNMFSVDAGAMIDSFLRDKNKLDKKEDLNNTTGLLYDLYLVLLGVLPFDVLDDSITWKLGVDKADIYWKREWGIPAVNDDVPCIIFLHGMGSNSCSLRRSLLPLLIQGKLRAFFIQGEYRSQRGKGYSYSQRTADDEIINPWAILHTVARRMKDIATEKGITFDGIYGFSQGAIIAALLVASWSKNLTPKVQANAMKFIIVQSGSENDWRRSLPACFEAMPIKVPAFISFGKNDWITTSKQQKLAFAGWFNETRCTRVDHCGSHSELPSNLSKASQHVEALVAFIEIHATQDVATQRTFLTSHALLA